MEAFVDVGDQHLDSTVVSFTNETGGHWLRRCSPRLHHEFDEYATMLVTVADHTVERDAVLSVPSARQLIARHYNYETTILDDDRPDPVVLVGAEPSDRTVWGPARISSDVGHELEPVLDEARSIPDGWRLGIDDGSVESVHPIRADEMDSWDASEVEERMTDFDDDLSKFKSIDDDGGDRTAYERLSAIRDQLTDITIPQLFDDSSDSDELDTDTQTSTHSDGRTSTSDDDTTTSTDTDNTVDDRRSGRRRNSISGRRRRRKRAAGSADTGSSD